MSDAAGLPDSYRRHDIVDLKKDRKLALAVQGGFVLLAVLAVAVALLAKLPLQTEWNPFVTIVVTVVACLVYMVAHEATHGVVLQILTKVKPSYRMRFPFLTTGGNAYLTPRSAIVVALAPMVIWAIVLIVALLVVPQEWRFTVYVVLALNFAGSSGDLVEVYVLSRQRRDALVQDDGDKIHVFHPVG
ncbi:DUF3267 domain-containing protein [Agromyces sp. NPDC049794]|uniref:DUF3267 domain-containing protein n=1 Tax=unclassified Agromyces TaxID=2639701 RepID=UPI0033DF2CEB